MFARIITLIALATLLGVALLHLRQQRIDAMHGMTRLHQQMNQSRKQQWDLQTHIADKLQPHELQAAFARAGLELEPITSITSITTPQDQDDVPVLPVRDHN